MTLMNIIHSIKYVKPREYCSTHLCKDVCQKPVVLVVLNGDIWLLQKYHLLINVNVIADPPRNDGGDRLRF